jgi:hypothetical protein
MSMKKVNLLICIILLSIAVNAQQVGIVKIEYIQKRAFQKLIVSISNNTMDTLIVPSLSKNRSGIVRHDYACDTIDYIFINNCYGVDGIMDGKVDLILPGKKWRSIKKFKMSKKYTYIERVYNIVG